MAQNEFLITDLVSEEAMRQLSELEKGITGVRDTFQQTARELARGATVKVTGIDELIKKSELLEEATRRAADAEEKLRQLQQQQQQQSQRLAKELASQAAAMQTAARATAQQAAEQQKSNDIRGETTNVISRELAEVEKENAAKRETYEIDRDALAVAGEVLGTYDENIKRLAELTQEIKANQQARTQLDKDEKDGIVTAGEAAAAREDLLKKERELKAERSDVQRVLQQEEKAAQATEGSYAQLSAQLERMKAAYRQLTAAEKQTAQGQTLQKGIQELDAHLKDAAADMGDFQRNVGNYAIAGQSARKEMAAMVQQIATLTLQYRALSDAEKNSPLGQAMAGQIQSMTEQAAKLKDALSDVQQSVQKASSDTRSLSAVTEGVNLLVSGMGSLKAASSLLGIGEKDLIKIQTELQSVLVISNTLTKVQTALQKQSALMQGVLALQTSAHNKAVALNTAAQSSNIVVTKAATIAQAAFNVVANANPYLLIATALITVVGALALFTKGTKSQAEEQKRLNDLGSQHLDFLKSQADYLTQSNQQNIDAYQRELDVMKERGASEQEQLALERKILDEREKAHAKTKGLYKEELDQYDENVKKVNRYRNTLQDLYKMAEGGVKTVKMDLDLDGKMDKMKIEEAIKEVQDALDNSENKVSAAMTVKVDESDIKAKQEELNAKMTAAYREAQKTETEALRAAEDARLALVQDSYAKQQMTIAAAAQRQAADLKLRLQTDANLTTTARQALADQIVSIQKKCAQDIAQAERDQLAASLKAQQTDLQNRIAAIRGDTDAELAERTAMQRELNEKLRQSEILEAEKTGADTAAINEKYIAQAEELERQAATARVQLVKTAADDEDKALQKSLNDLKTRYAAGEMDNEQYQKATATVTANYSMKKYTAMRDAFVKMLSLSDLTDELRDKVNEAIEGIDTSILDLKVDASEEEIKERAKLMAEHFNKVAKAAEALQQVGGYTSDAANGFAEMEQALGNTMERFARLMADSKSDWKDYFAAILQGMSEVVSGLADAMSGIFQAQIDAIQDEIDANSDAYDEEADNIDNLVEQGVISTEQGEARKRQAEIETENKNAELEKQKAALEAKQAKYQKAADIVSATTATSVAIMQCYSQLGPIAGAIMSAVVAALGAAQIAAIAATPLAQYAKGTKDHPGGLAVVGEAGERELVLTPSGGAYLTPDTATLVDLPRHSQVIPRVDADSLTRVASDYEMLREAWRRDGEGEVVVNLTNDYRDLEAQMELLVKESRRAYTLQRRAVRRADFDAILRRVV